jgi:hypothetical protein
VLEAARRISTTRGVSIGSVISDFARRGMAPEVPSALRNGIRLFPVRKDAGNATPELVKELLARC